MKYFCFLFVITLITACASLSEKECKGDNWFEIGKKDGLRGQTSSRINNHKEACAEYGITPNLDSYKVGYVKGRKSYCTSKGMSNGKLGKEDSAPRSCQESPLYKMSFKKGYKVFCKAEGVKAGTAAKQDSGRENCLAMPEYKSGFSKGLRSYCTKENGVSHGRGAKEHKASLCPSSLRSKFMRGYQDGAVVYCGRMNGFKIGQEKGSFRPSVCPNVLRSDFEAAYQKGIEYKSLQEKIKVLDSNLKDLKVKISNPDTSSDLKAYLLKELGEKGVEKRSLEVRRTKIEGFIGI